MIAIRSNRQAISLDSVVNKNTEKKFDNNGNDIFAHAYLTPTNYNYTWVGNHWYPPMDAPNLRVQEIRRLFQSENTLWLGDSTCRQDFQTMYHMISSKNPNNILVSDLERNINKGKATEKLLFYKPEIAMNASLFDYFCPARSVPKNESIIFQELGQVPGTDQNCSVVAVKDKDAVDPLSSWSQFSLEHQKKGKFDRLRLNCLCEVTSTLTNHTELLQREYTTLILSVGVWEVVRPWDCRGTGSEGGILELVKVLNMLHQMSGPSFFIVWKTHGHAGGSTGGQLEKSQNVTEVTRRWFSEKEPEYMDLADFELAVNKRQHGVNRINGDRKPHWGLEARLLSIDLMSRAVKSKQKRSAKHNDPNEPLY